MSDANIVQLLGLIYLGLGLGFLINKKALKRVLEDFIDRPALGYVGGVAAIIIGYVLIINHNTWVWDWPVIVTVLGWAGFIKGYSLLVFPQWSADIVKMMSKKNWFLKYMPCVATILVIALLIVNHYYMK